MSDIVIRPARRGDAAQVYALLSAVIAEGGLFMSDAPPNETSFRRFVSANIEAGAPFWVAESAGSVVGWADVIPATQRSRHHVGRVGMGVAKPWRQQGVGRRLLQTLLNEARASGFLRLELDVFTDNQAAVALYRSVGFREEGRHLAVRWSGNHWQHSYSMALLMA